MDIELQKLKIHLIYLVSILTFLLVVTASKQWSPNEGFTVFLSNAATATSLVLGVIAIVYAFVSNSDLSKGLGNITLASNEISKTRDQLSALLGQAQDLNKSGSENAKQLQDASTNITNKMVGLNETLVAIVEKTGALHTSVNSIPARMDRIENMLEEKKPNQSTLPTSINFTSKNIDQFLARSPLSGNFIAYACALTKNKNIELNFGHWAEQIGLNNANFLSGFLSSMNAIGLVKRKFIPDKEKTYSVTEIDPNLTVERVENYIVNYLNSENGLAEKDVKIWQERFEALKQMYA